MNHEGWGEHQQSNYCAVSSVEKLVSLTMSQKKIPAPLVPRLWLIMFQTYVVAKVVEEAVGSGVGTGDPTCPSPEACKGYALLQAVLFNIGLLLAHFASKNW